MFSARPQMTRDEQCQFVKDLVERIAHDIYQNIWDGNVPEYWGGIELRLYIAEAMERGCAGRTFATDKDMKEYRNDVLVRGL